MMNSIKLNVQRIEYIEKIDILNEELSQLNSTQSKSAQIIDRISSINDEIDRLSVLLNACNDRLIMSNAHQLGFGFV